MKSVSKTIVFLCVFLSPVAIMAQVVLPIDAGNCAILNALKPDNLTVCNSPTLGTPRGLIVNINGVDSVPTTSTTTIQTVKSAPKTIAISRSAIKAPDPNAENSNDGYYIHFAFDSDTLEKDYKAHLTRLAVVLKSEAMASNCIKITGHTDTVGDAKYNLTLSNKRAKSVHNYLTTVEKIPVKRITTHAAGETQPLAGKIGTSPFNRRVEFSSKTIKDGCKV